MKIDKTNRTKSQSNVATEKVKQKSSKWVNNKKEVEEELQFDKLGSTRSRKEKIGSKCMRIKKKRMMRVGI